MKKVLLLFTVTLLLPIASVFSQTLSDYVKQVKGDTLVIKDYSDMNNQSNSLYWALTLDTVNVPAGRVYELQSGGLYPLGNDPLGGYPITGSPTSSALHPTVIVGPDPTMVVNNKNAASAPPLICTYDLAWGVGLGINAGGDLTIKNCELSNTADDGRIGIYFTGTFASNLHLVYDNCIFEKTAHWFVFIRNNSNQNVTFRNCYFVNMNGQPCRRDGGVFISFNNQDTLLVENCTHIMAQGGMYKFMIDSNYPIIGNYEFKRIIFNHNTFVNNAGYTFMNPGYQSNVSFTNNMFISCNVQCFAPILSSLDVDETDPDNLPMGFVNVYPDSADVANNTPRKFLCQDNLVYWDPSFANMDSILNANKVNGVTNWQSQMIIMNSRADSMFKHIGRFNTTPYRYLLTDTWKNQMPHFTDPQNLFTTQLANLKTFAVSTVDANSVAVLPDWRLISTAPDSYVHPDWPIPVDLSYSDADLQTAGLSGFPLGDLNWFPTQKVTWLAQRNAEYTHIQSALDLGTTTAVNDIGGNVLREFSLDQNYPNPFNPSTTISFSIPKAGYVTLKVYDILGQEIATLLDGFKAPQTYNLRFDGTGLASGVYFYKLTAPGFTQVKKMVLTK
jgi:hypothetical protein